MDFVALDFETANAKKAPCSIGLVVVINNEVAREYYTLINPEQGFGHTAIRIHGITKAAVVDSPTFPHVWQDIRDYFRRLPVVAHNVPFELSVLEKTARRYKLHLPTIVYYDTLKLFQHNFPNTQGFDLPTVCAACGVVLDRHHHALSDAKAAAGVMLSMVKNDSCDIFPSIIAESFDLRESEYIAERVRPARPLVSSNEPEYVATSAVMCDVGEIVISGSTFVITGAIAGYGRMDLENAIQERGGRVTGSVSIKTNYVVVGLQDVSVVKDKEGAKSSKILKAEELRDSGVDIKIIAADTLLSALNKERLSDCE